MSTTNWFPSVLGHCWFGHLACKNRPRNDLLCVEWDAKPTHSLTHIISLLLVYIVSFTFCQSSNKAFSAKQQTFTKIL